MDEKLQPRRYSLAGLRAGGHDLQAKVFSVAVWATSLANASMSSGNKEVAFWAGAMFAGVVFVTLVRMRIRFACAYLGGVVIWCELMILTGVMEKLVR